MGRDSYGRPGLEPLTIDGRRERASGYTGRFVRRAFRLSCRGDRYRRAGGLSLDAESGMDAGVDASRDAIQATESVDDTVAPADGVLEHPYTRVRTQPASAVRNGLAFSFLAALSVLQPLCFHTYVLLLWDDSPLRIQRSLPDGVPIPRAMLWDPRLYNVIAVLGQFVPAAVLGLEITIVLGMVY